MRNLLTKNICTKYSKGTHFPDLFVMESTTNLGYHNYAKEIEMKMINYFVQASVIFKSYASTSGSKNKQI